MVNHSIQLYDKNYKRLLILPVALTLLFLFVVFVYPTPTLGLDFAGGTRIIVSASGLNEQGIKDILLAEQGLSEVKVTIVESSFGANARIEYPEPSSLTDARNLLLSAVANKKDTEGARASLIGAMQKLNQTISSELSVDDMITAVSEAISIESGKISDGVIQSLKTKFSLPADTEFTIEEVTPTFGATFLANTIFVSLISIVLLTIVIFIFFRELVPSLAVVEAALFDMLTAVALLTFFGFSITLSTVAALLMMVGYSVDTDILLTTRLLKRKDKTIYERANDTLSTGLTVTATLIGAVLVMLFVSWTAQITTIFEIAVTILFGLLGDLVATWFTNAPILMWYWERKHGHAGEHHE